MEEEGSEVQGLPGLQESLLSVVFPLSRGRRDICEGSNQEAAETYEDPEGNPRKHLKLAKCTGLRPQACISNSNGCG